MSVITHPDVYPIRPSMIDTDRHFFDAFGSCESEISAAWIVRLCQRLGGWHAFTRAMIETFYNEGGYQGFVFNGLERSGFIHFGEDRQYRVTSEFVDRCYEAAPAFQPK